MLINIKNKKDLITLDLTIKQLRYIRGKNKEIFFLDLSNSDKDAYTFLFKEDKPLFFKSLKEDIKNFLSIDINIKNLKVLTQTENNNSQQADLRLK